MGKRTIVTYDQVRFTLDADVQKVWAKIGTTPIVYKNGSKKALNFGGAYTTGKFHAFPMQWQQKEEVLPHIKKIHALYPDLFLLLDKATWNKNNLILNYLKTNKIPFMFFPTGASDRNPTEECWRQTRQNVTDTSHNTEKHLKTDLEKYWNTQPFKHNVFNYLSP